MKKILSLTMAFLLSASVCLFSSCQYIDGLLDAFPSFPSDKTECTAHSFGEWETVKEASCVVGEKQRVCGNCDFTETEEISALDDFFAHTFDENTLCTTCGHQEFIESEEYIEISSFRIEDNNTIPMGITWWNYDKTYGVTVTRYGHHNKELDKYIYGIWIFKHFVGSPINVVLPASYQGQPLVNLGTAFVGAFTWTSSLESIIIPKTVSYIGPWSFQGSTSLTSVFLEGKPEIENWAFYDCDNATIYYYSEEEPTEEGNYWHYVDGKLVIWE